MNSFRKNGLISLLSGLDREKLEKELILVSLVQMKRLYEQGNVVDAVYFPLDCVLSVVVGVGEPPDVEVATIGNEGVTGAFSILSPGGGSIGGCIVQVPGDALRLDVQSFRRHVAENALFRLLIRRYIDALARQIMQVSACRQRHNTMQRCVLWLLMAHDRSGSDTFQLSQQFLAATLGLRRATVSAAMGALKAAGYVRYVRGQITIVDRKGLESAACPCYGLIQSGYKAIRLPLAIDTERSI